MIELLVDTSVAIPLVVSSHKAHRLVMDRVGSRRIALVSGAVEFEIAIRTCTEPLGSIRTNYAEPSPAS